MKFRVRSARFKVAVWLLIAALLFYVLLPAVLNEFYATPGMIQVGQEGVSITDSGTTNSSDGKPLRLLTLQNGGKVALRRQEYFTLYWTNSSGNSTDCFVSLGSSAVINPGKSETFAVDPPACVGKWRSSFAFSFELGKTARFIQKTALSEVIPRDWSLRFDQVWIFYGPEVDGISTTKSVFGEGQTDKNDKREK